MYYATSSPSPSNTYGKLVERLKRKNKMLEWKEEEEMRKHKEDVQIFKNERERKKIEKYVIRKNSIKRIERKNLKLEVTNNKSSFNPYDDIDLSEEFPTFLLDDIESDLKRILKTSKVKQKILKERKEYLNFVKLATSCDTCMRDEDK
ncbi:hypothetical protein ABK040_013378 [Willaertia magna]